MSDTEVLVKVEGVGKKFCRSLKKSLLYGVSDIARDLNPFGSAAAHPAEHLRPEEFWAVNGVSFELRRGECLGLIGRNGAGKTTLLKMLNGLIKPDAGRIEMRGRLGALIALGAGFNPILTGRENIYVNGSILGLTKREIDERMEGIIDFAEMREFIDAPVQSYSSGMQVRLGFAVASALDPDVLILDEVLAVGDAAFRNKCYNRIGSLRKKAAVIFVSHSMEQVVMICDQTLVLRKGQMVQSGPVAEGVSCYEALNEDGQLAESDAFDSMLPPVRSCSFQVGRSAQYGGYLSIRGVISCDGPVPNAVFRIIVYNPMHVIVAEWNSRRIGQKITLEGGISDVALELGPLIFKKGTYRLGIVLSDSTGARMLIWSYKVHHIELNSFTQVGPDVALGSPIMISSRLTH